MSRRTSPVDVYLVGSGTGSGPDALSNPACRLDCSPTPNSLSLLSARRFIAEGSPDFTSSWLPRCTQGDNRRCRESEGRWKVDERNLPLNCVQEFTGVNALLRRRASQGICCFQGIQHHRIASCAASASFAPIRRGPICMKSYHHNSFNNKMLYFGGSMSPYLDPLGKPCRHPPPPCPCAALPARSCLDGSFAGCHAAATLSAWLRGLDGYIMLVPVRSLAIRDDRVALHTVRYRPFGRWKLSHKLLGLLSVGTQHNTSF